MNKTKQIIASIVCLIVIAAGIYTLADPDALIRYKTDDKNFDYIEEDGGIVLTEYNGEEENLIIPSNIDSKKVLAIRGAFCNNETLKNVKISEGVESVDYMAFYGCTALVKVRLPSTVKTIGHAAFLGCMALETVITGGSLKEIMPYAFSDCIFLSKITLPQGLLFIGENAFKRCTHLEKLSIPSSVEVIGGVTLEKGQEGEDQRGSTDKTSFDGCDRLRLTISDDNPFYAIESGKITRKGELK